MGLVTDPNAPRPALTFFFPAYNEEENVERTVELALAEIGRASCRERVWIPV